MLLITLRKLVLEKGYNVESLSSPVSTDTLGVRVQLVGEYFKISVGNFLYINFIFILVFKFTNSCCHL